jgi:putative transposase
VIRSYKYRLYPTKKQVRIIESQFDFCRWLYNTALEHRVTAYKKLGKFVTYTDQANELPAIKNSIPNFTKIHSQVLQDVLKRIDKGFQNFFRRIKQGQTPGFPRFKSKDNYKSITYPQSGFSIKGNKLHLAKIGLVRIKQHRAIPDGSEIKTCTITRCGNQWYCSITVEYQIVVPKKVVNTAVGIDLGLNSFAVLSDGVVINNPRYYRKAQEELKEIQSKYSKHKSKAIKRKLSALHRKVANRRKDFLHKESRNLINQYDLIAHEDLNIKGLAQTSLSKSVHDAGWGMFINMLTYKAEEAGTYAVAVNPYRTSQICSNCGTIVKKTLAQRQHDCPNCGLNIDRDLNAAHNILKLGTSLAELKIPIAPFKGSSPSLQV